MKVSVIGEGKFKSQDTAIPNGFSQDAKLSDLITGMEIPSQIIFGRKTLSCKLCGSTHTLRKIEDGYLCELHFKELRRAQNENR